MFKFAIGDLRLSEVYNAKRKKQSFPHCIYITPLFQSEPGSVVGIATGYGLSSPGIESSWGEIFRTCPDRTWGPRNLLYNGCGVKSGRGVTLSPHPLLVPWSRKNRAIPLLPLRTVRPVQSLSPCIRVHFTFTLTSISKHVLRQTVCAFSMTVCCLTYRK